MLETATTQPTLRIAFDRAHAERSQAFRAVGRWIGGIFAQPRSFLKAKGADQTDQPLRCDCPA
ncbi:hypothetical protein SAMN04488030_2260 [Aliiroseovarius halocynthiae]|nr:hypothetical protein SAMN04488030_2260 [Aliiroseovarius halocynthiae]